MPVDFLSATGGTLSNTQTATGANGAATATFTASSAGAGSVQVTVDQQTLTASLTLQDYAVSIAPSQQSVTAGAAGSVNYTGIITGQNGFSGTVNLSCTATPASSGVTASCPTTVAVTNGQSATFTVAVLSTANATPVTYQISASASNGDQTRTASASFSVADFTLNAQHLTLTTNSGVSTTLTDLLTLNSTSGLSGPVSLNCSSPANSGISVSCSPASLTLPVNTPQPATLTIAAPSTLPSGNYPISITATAPAVSRSVTINVVFANYTVAVTPATQSINAEGSASYTISVSSSNGFNFSAFPMILLCSVPSGSGLIANCPSTLTPNPGGGASAVATVSTNGAASGTSSVSFTAASGAASASTTASLTVGNISITSSGLSQTVNGGTAASASYALTLNSLGGFSGTVALACAAPTGSAVTSSCAPASVVVPVGGSATTTLTISNAATVSPGSYPIPITATGPGVTRTVTPALVIADYTLSAAPASVLALAGGTSAPLTITGSTSSGFNGAVTFAPADVSGLPPGATVTYSASSIVVRLGSTTNLTGLSINVPGSTSPGTYAITAIGRSGSLAHSLSFSLVVSGFGLNVNAPGASISMVAGATGTFNLAAQSLSGFSGTVNLAAAITGTTATGSPSFPTLALSALSVPLSSGTQSAFTLTAQTTNLDTPATYTITVTATAGAITKTTILTLVVAPPPPDFDIVNFTPSTTTQSVFAINTSAFVESVGGFNSPITVIASQVSGPALPSTTLFGFCQTCGELGGPVPPVYTTTTTLTLIPLTPGFPTGSTGFTLSPTVASPLTVGNYIFRLTLSGGGVTHTTDFAVTIIPPQSFTMTTNPGIGTNTTISQGQTATFTVTLSNVSVLAGTVFTFSDPDLTQAGALVSFSPPTLSANGTSIMTVTATGDTKTGILSADIVASAGTAQLTGAIELFLTVNPSLAASISPTSQSVQPGGSASYTVTPLAFSGCAFIHGIPISVAGLPAGATLSTADGINFGTTVMTITTSITIVPDAYPLTVSGNNCGHSFSIPATLIIPAPAPPPPPTGGCTGGERPICEF